MSIPSVAVEESGQSALGGRGTELIERGSHLGHPIAAVNNDVKGHVQMLLLSC